ncbi:hypothetical protein [Oribacterium sp. WCC10]|uniref:hypothetical protein n=1 Tax=Oribacterium sp. WCC10 TaxID=1855343 RepID=UPI0011145882|nr:hypothetical protein [Oribacterium sp. WCC10]
MKKLFRYIAVTAGVVTTLCSTSFAQAVVRNVGVVKPIQIVVDSDYILAKVNDPVSRKDQQAYIVADNAAFHLVSDSYSEAEVIFCINEFVDGQDAGVSNRVLKKTVSMGEELTMLPADTFDDGVADGSAYKITDRCYAIKVYGSDKKNCDIFYFGLVDEDTYDKMAETSASAT